MKDFKDLFNNNLCLRCTGRIFADVNTGLTNIERGKFLLFAYKSFYGDIEIKDSCWLCNNIFNEFDKYYNIINDRIKNYEYNTFLIGSKFDDELLLNEEKIQNSFGNKGESIKKEFNREFGKYFSLKTGKDFSKNPDILFEINTLYDDVKITVKSLYIYGTYIKKRRDIPQTRWIHGNGDSIESIIGEPLKELTGGKNYKLHGSGREDVDVMMLGNGREFVIEIIDPEKRNISLNEFIEKVNDSKKNVFIYNLEFTDKEKIKEIKEAKYDKTYIASIELPDSIDINRFKEYILLFKDKTIDQRTPLRVLGNRSDLIRKKEIKYINIEDIHNNIARIKICAESGTYIKELINGDNGRTVPSLSSICNSNLQVISLDVVYIGR